MKQILCASCGSNVLDNIDGYFVCRFCNSKFKLEPEQVLQNSSSSVIVNQSSNISLQSDIDVLLQKCRDDPLNAQRYAGLILDIDPTNQEAQKYF